jgi:uncharacterized protein (TIGR03437 family)
MSSCQGLSRIVLLLAASHISPAYAATRQNVAPAQPARRWSFPLYFEANQGQADSSVQFLSRGHHSSILLKSGGRATFLFPEGSLQMKMGGAAMNSQAVGIEPLSGTLNYFVGSEHSKWRTNVTAYSAVKFKRVYRGVDLIYHGKPGRLEYDFVVAPHADAHAISLEFSGAEKIEIDDSGNLVFILNGGTVVHRKPSIYQVSGRQRRGVAGRYVLAGRSLVRFEIAEYDRHLPLVIDPVLSYATFFGGANDDGAFSIALDRDGNIYLAGITGSPNFPRTSGPGLSGATDAFVAKLNPTGTTLLYAAYLGGSGQEAAMAVTVDAAGSAYVTGGTNSRDFPVTSGAFQAGYGGTGGHSFPPFNQPSGDAFVSKLSPTGSALVYSTYLGGTGVDQGYGIAVDSSGAAYVAGATDSMNFPVTPGAFQPMLRGFGDAFIAKIDPAGSRLLYSTLVGGIGSAVALALDSAGNAYVTGFTASDDFPTTPGAFQTQRKGDAPSYVLKLNSTGTALVYSTYLGASGSDATELGVRVTEAYGIAVDSAGSAYVTGATNTPHFPVTVGAFQSRSKPESQGGDVFVSKLDPSGSSLVYSTVFGGSGPDFGSAIAVDQAGNAYVAGRTLPYGNGRWIDFPTTPEAIQRCGTGNPSAFLVKLNATGSTLEYSSYLGTGFGGGSSATAIALDSAGSIRLAGSTTAGFPVTNEAFQTKYGGGIGHFDSTNLFPFGGDAFVATVDLSAESPPMTISCEANAANLASGLVSPGEIISLFGTKMGPLTGVAAGLDANRRLPTSIAGARVLFDGNPVPLLYVRADQINAVAPFGLTGKTSTQIEVEFQGIKSGPLTARVAEINPGIFTLDSSGSGQAAALNEDDSVNSTVNPARAGSIMSLFATGAGVLNPTPEDGITVEAPLPQTLPAAVYVGTCATEVLYSGSAPGLVAGAIQINFRAPAQPVCLRDNVPVVVLFGGARSQTYATISVR